MEFGNPIIYARTPAQLKSKAVLFWPEELATQEASASIIPLLLQTQDKFISLLNIANSSPDAWKTALQTSKELTANLFLKHLMVLADFGGEPLKRLRLEMETIFPDAVMTYRWSDATYQYRYKQITQAARLDNTSLFVDGRSLLVGHDLNDRLDDVIMLLLHGAASVDPNVPQIVKERCVIGSLIGHEDALEKFVRQRYIWVSRITGGATSNAMGQIAQDYVRNRLIEALPDWQIIRNGTVPGISHNAGRTDISFDIVARSPEGQYTAIEVSFQFTTNSVVERKAGQAQARAELLHGAGHRIAYVIDGAGNFERAAALNTLCRFSDCTVAFTLEEMAVLVDFLRSTSARLTGTV